MSLAVSSEYGAVAAEEELADHLASVVVWCVLSFLAERRNARCDGTPMGH